MANLTNSRSLSDFQRNARSFIQDVNANKEPLLLTVNGQIQAVIVDPATYQELEEHRERELFLAAIKEGLRDLEEGRVRPAEAVFEELKAKYGF